MSLDSKTQEQVRTPQLSQVRLGRHQQGVTVSAEALGCREQRRSQLPYLCHSFRMGIVQAGSQVG